MMWAKKFKGMSVAKGFSLELTGMKEMPNKYEDPDDMKSTTDEEKAAVKSMRRNSLAVAYLYQAVDTTKYDGCIRKAFSDKLPDGIVHRTWTLLHERFAKSYALSTSELRKEMQKIKLKENENSADLFEEMSQIETQVRKIQGDSIIKSKL